MPAWTAKPIVTAGQAVANASAATGAASVNAWLLDANPFISLGLAIVAALLGVAANHLRNPRRMTGGELAGRYIVGVAVGIFFYVALEEYSTRRAWLIGLTWVAAYAAESILPRLEQAAVSLVGRVFGEAGKGPESGADDER